MKIRLYLDNCCFNRPFDDQSQIRIRLEAEAKLKIQEEIRSGTFQLIWSYILDYNEDKISPGTLFSLKKCRVSESNQGHGDFQSPALPTELTRHW